MDGEYMTQNDWVFKRLHLKKPLTAIEALNGCWCFRLAARINDLRRQGHKIKRYWIEKGGKKFAGYVLEQQKVV